MNDTNTVNTIIFPLCDRLPQDPNGAIESLLILQRTIDGVGSRPLCMALNALGLGLHDPVPLVDLWFKKYSNPLTNLRGFIYEASDYIQRANAELCRTASLN